MKLKFYFNERDSMTRVLLLLALALLSPIAHGEVYKCMGADKKISYQEKPCEKGQDKTVIKFNQSIPNNTGVSNLDSRGLRSCEDFRTIAAKAADLANKGVSASAAKITINEPKFDGIINHVFEGNNSQERERIVRDYYMACQDKRSGKGIQAHWTRDEFKQHFFKSCKESIKSKYKSVPDPNAGCSCFANTLIGSMSNSDMERASANLEVFNDHIKSNLQLFEKCGIQ